MKRDQILRARISDCQLSDGPQNIKNKIEQERTNLDFVSFSTIRAKSSLRICETISKEIKVLIIYNKTHQ